MIFETRELDHDHSVKFPDISRILSEETGLLITDVRRIVSSAETSYKTFTIPKRSGGERLISQPARPVKMLQKALMHRVLSQMPVHHAATAYRKNKSIVDNASPHTGSERVLLKIDFLQFFPSIKHSDWMYFCKLNNILNQNDLLLTSKLLFKKEVQMRGLRLAIGAPSSPMLSNILMYEFDKLVDETIASTKVVYTRYADDLTFSAPRTGYLVDVQSSLRKIIRNLSHPRLTINEKKTVFATTKYRRTVTGVVLSNQGDISLGREKKRLLSSRVHHAKLALLSNEQLKCLSGHLAHAYAVEPKFVTRLEEKYGSDLINSLKKLGNPATKAG